VAKQKTLESLSAEATKTTTIGPHKSWTFCSLADRSMLKLAVRTTILQRQRVSRLTSLVLAFDIHRFWFWNDDELYMDERLNGRLAG
jgi:hypothetical protein